MQNALVVPGPVRPGPPVSPLELAQLVSVVASQPARWHPTVRFDPARRWFAQLELTTDLEVWLLSWLPGQGTGFHDHGAAVGAFTVLVAVQLSVFGLYLPPVFRCPPS